MLRVAYFAVSTSFLCLLMVLLAVQCLSVALIFFSSDNSFYEVSILCFTSLDLARDIGHIYSGSMTLVFRSVKNFHQRQKAVLSANEF